jgi:hypothetical protein
MGGEGKGEGDKLMPFLMSITGAFVKSQKMPISVIPAKAGIQFFRRLTKNLDPVFQRGDNFLRVHHPYCTEVVSGRGVGVTSSCPYRFS